MILNLPAVYLGACFEILLAVFRVPTGEPTLLASISIFVPLIWSRVGRWIDAQSALQRVSTANDVKLNSAWTMVARILVWMLFLMLLFAFTVERHRAGEATRFLQAAAIGWAAAYLAAGLWGDWRRSARRRATRTDGTTA